MDQGASDTRARLVRSVLLERFGADVKTVGAVLYQKGALPLALTKAEAKLKLKRTQEAMFVLYHQDLVDVDVLRSRGETRFTVYSLNEDSVLQRLFYPMYLQMICANHGEEAVELVKELMVHCKLRETTLVQNVLARCSDLSEAVVHAKLDALYREYFVIQHATFVPIVPEIENDKTKRRKTNRGNAELVAPPPRTYHPSATPGFVMINRRRFELHFKMQTIVKMVEDRHTSRAAQLMHHILRVQTPPLARTCHTNPTQIDSLPMTRNEIYSIASESMGFSADELDRYLKALSQEPLPFLNFEEGPGGGSYVVPIRTLLERHKRFLLTSYIQERYGPVAQRIVHVLMEKKRLEQKELSKLLLANWSEIRSIMYELLSAGVLHLQEIPRTPDRQAARTFYLWLVDWNKCMSILINTMETAVISLRERVAHERDSNQLLLTRVQQAQAQIVKYKAEFAQWNTDEKGPTDEDALVNPEEMSKLSINDILSVHDVKAYESLTYGLNMYTIASERVLSQLQQLAF